MSERLEGSGPSQLVQLIKQIGYNKDIDIELATVTSSSPLKVKVDNMKIELEGSDLVIAEYLTKHTREIRITTEPTDDGLDSSYLHYRDELKTGDRIIVASINDGQTYIILDRAVTN